MLLAEQTKTKKGAAVLARLLLTQIAVSEIIVS
jgi:hypothetical protein